MSRLAAGLLLSVSSGFRNVKRRPETQGRQGAGEKDVSWAYERMSVPDDNPKHSALPPSGLADYPTCHLSRSDCRLEDMTEATVVYVDSDDARCWNGDPFAFAVKPGRSDKLYWYFPGGGACFDNPGWTGGVTEGCFPSMDLGLIALGYGGGAHDFENPDNVFHDYTFITAPYCSGGGHVANTSFTEGGKTYYQYGYNNNEHLRVWAMNQVNRGIDKRLKSFVAMGSSAGSLGVALWADTLLSNFQYEKASVIFDSYMGVFPGDSQGNLMKHLGACPIPPMTPFRDDCENGDGNLEPVIDRLIGKYPNVAFASLQSKADGIQLAFYTVIGIYFSGGWPLIDPKAFYYITNYMMGVYNKHPNYVTYLVNGDFHVFPVYPTEWYTTSTLGPNTTAPAGTPMLYKWIEGVVNHDAVSSQCAGERAENGAWINNYCDETLFPKQLRT